MRTIRRTPLLPPGDEESIVNALREEFQVVARGHHLGRSGEQIRAAAEGPGKRTRRRPARLALLAPVAAAAAVLAILLATGALHAPASGPPATAGQCRSTPVIGTLPTWARAGFTPPTSAQTYVWGHDKRLVGILFGPLSSPPAHGRGNKILWVLKDPGDAIPARIVARSSVTDAVTRVNRPGGPGPSLVDVPAPGCWRFTVTWPGGSDTVDLDYRAGP